ncbi:Pycsar system effector family protein [Streptomyces niveus]|uniref:Pycsar system effector family protein n=1 Tax=Streptomyces niveus TaxID=193462 RepID=UPI0036A8666C
MRPAAPGIPILLVVRPDLGGGNRTVQEGFPRWARTEESVPRQAMTKDTRIARVKALSGIAVGKFQLLTRAVDIIRAALALLVPAAVGTALRPGTTWSPVPH